MDGRESIINHAKFTRDGTQVLAIDNAGEFYVRDMETGVNTVNSMFSGSPVCLLVSNDGRRYYVGLEKAIHIFDVNSHKELKKINLVNETLNDVELMPLGTQLLLHYSDGSKAILDTETGSRRLLGSLAKVKHLQFFGKGSRLINEAEGLITISTWPDLKKIASFFSVDSTADFTIINNGYYQASPEATKLLHYVTDDLRIISFEQLDVQYNRPDKVLAAIGNKDSLLQLSYRNAWQKRIKRLGIDTSLFISKRLTVPEADFANRELITYNQQNRKLELRIKANDNYAKLNRFNIWVNESPVYGKNGIGLQKKLSNHLDTTISIILSQGENMIETSVTNSNGMESYRMPLLVNYTPSVASTVKTYFLGIGIDQFADSTYDLKYSCKDIRDLAGKLTEKYPSIIIDTLFNKQVTVENIMALKRKISELSVDDRVIISYSGHGLMSKKFDYFLSTYNTNFQNPESDGLPYEMLENLLDSIPSRRKILFLDACHSGEVDKDDLMALNSVDKNLKKGVKPLAYRKQGKLGLKNSFELMQELFVNVGKSTGATIISAAAGTQFALEGVQNLPNGVFTYSILEAMNRYPNLKVSELKKIVADRVVALTKGLQRPTSRNETIAVDWNIW